MKSILIVLVFIFTSSISSAQGTPEGIALQFFEKYKLGNSDKAIDFLFTHSKYAKDIEEGIEDLKRKLKKSVDQLGVLYGVDLLVTKTAGENVKMLTYLVRHDREPLVFNILFYRPNKTWQLQNFKFGATIDDELEEASKAYRMKENFEN